MAEVTYYYPFGLEMEGRMMKDASYRFGFNGKEKDNEGEWGNSAHYDYGFRIYDPSIARFLSVDPLTAIYPWYTPYQFAGNMPIWAIDVDGLEPSKATGDDEPLYRGNLPAAEVVGKDESESKESSGIGLSARYTNSSLMKRSQLFATNNPIGRAIGASEREGNYFPIAGNLSVSEFSPNSRYTNDIGKVALVGIGGPLLIIHGLPLILQAGSTSVTLGLRGAKTSWQIGKSFFSIETSIKAGSARFIADGLVQGFFSLGQEGRFIDNYNPISGLSSFFLANPFASAGVGGTFSITLNDGPDFIPVKGVASSLIGGGLGLGFSKTWTRFSSSFKKISWQGGYGETLSITNPIVTGVGLSVQSFNKMQTRLGASLFQEKK